MSTDLPALPTNIDATYPDRSPGDKVHQQNHDTIGAAFAALNAAGGVVTPADLDAYAGPGGSDAAMAGNINTSGSATSTALNAEFARKSLLPAARVRCWGHSIMYGGSTQNADACVVGTNDQATLLAAHLGLPLDKQAVSGASLYNHLSDADWASIMQYETRPTQFAAIGGVYALMYGINDAAYLGDTTTALAPFKHALRATLARLRCSAVFEDDNPTNLTYGGSGAWATSGATNANSGKGYTWNATSGGTFTITLPKSFPGGTINIAFATNQDAGGGGIITAPAALGSVSINTHDFAGTDCWRTGVLRIKNVPSGNTTIPTSATYTFTTSGVTGTRGVILDWWGWEPPDDQCPIVALVGQPKPIDYSSESAAPFGAVGDAGVDAINTISQQVSAEFGARVPYVDTSYYDHNTNAPVGHPFYVMANVHPSADVHAGMAQLTADAIKKVGATIVPADLNTAPAGVTGWVGFNPTLNGAGSALGNGTSTAYYRKDSDGTVDMYGRYTFGTTTVVGTTIEIPLPLAERAGATLIAEHIYLSQSGIGTFPMIGTLGNTAGAVRVWLQPRGVRALYISTTNGSATITGPAGSFSSEDVGAQIKCGGIATTTSPTITAVASDTSATISINASATATNTALLSYKLKAPSSTQPLTWGPGSSLFFSGRYRSA